MLEVRLLAFRKEEPFVDVMIDKVPRQQFVMAVVSEDKRVGIGKSGKIRTSRTVR